MPKKILFFIESLCAGGKERRLVELLHYLKRNTAYEIKLVITENDIHYSYIKEIGIPITILKRGKLKKNPLLFYKFYKIAKSFNPDIISTWGKMTTIYAIPSKLLLKKKLCATLISDAQKDFAFWSLDSLFFKLNVTFSDLIFGNSVAGFKAYNLDKNKKKRLIYNGVSLDRFDLNINKDEVRNKLQIHTRYLIIMVASTSKLKDYDLFLDVAKQISSTFKDVTFLGVGTGSEFDRLQDRIITESISNVYLAGKRTDIEKLVASSDIGVLFSNCEGISNAIIEYMALSLPVVTTDNNGGSCELIEQKESGYIVEPNVDLITDTILMLLEDCELRDKLGKNGRRIIENNFSILRMGKEYKQIFDKLN